MGCSMDVSARSVLLAHSSPDRFFCLRQSRGETEPIVYITFLQTGTGSRASRPRAAGRRSEAGAQRGRRGQRHCAGSVGFRLSKVQAAIRWPSIPLSGRGADWFAAHREEISRRDQAQVGIACDLPARERVPIHLPRPRPAAARRSARTDAPHAGIASLPEIALDASRAGPPGSPGAASRFPSTRQSPRSSPLRGRQPQSHERSLPLHRQAKSERDAKRNQSELPCLGRWEEREAEGEFAKRGRCRRTPRLWQFLSKLAKLGHSREIGS